MTMIRATKEADADLKLASLVVALREIAAQFEGLGSGESVPAARALALNSIGMQLRRAAHEALQFAPATSAVESAPAGRDIEQAK